MLTVEEKRTAADVIALIASTVNGFALPVNEITDWQGIIDFAKKQSVLNLVAYAAESLKIKPDERTMRFLDEFRMQRWSWRLNRSLPLVTLAKSLIKWVFVICSSKAR